MARYTASKSLCRSSSMIWVPNVLPVIIFTPSFSIVSISLSSVALWQAVFRDAVAHHSTRFALMLENGNVMAVYGAIVGSGKPGRPCAHDGDLFACGPRFFLGSHGSSLAISQSATNRLILLIATGVSTRLRRHAASQGWGQTRPQTTGNGLLFLITLKASSKLP